MYTPRISLQIGVGTPGVTGYFEVEIENDKLLHSKKVSRRYADFITDGTMLFFSVIKLLINFINSNLQNGGGFVDTPAKMQVIVDGIKVSLTH